MLKIEGYEEAVEKERVSRAVAFLPGSEKMCGVSIVSMTPVHWEWFRASKNPYVCGGIPKPSDALHALWLISTGFEPDSQKAQSFIKSRLATINHAELHRDMNEYLDRMFLDAPYGKEGMPYFSAAAGMVYEMAQEPYRWSMTQTLATPLVIIFQLIKARDKGEGRTVINRLSDKVRGDWLDQQNILLAEQRKKDARRANRKRPKNNPDDGR